MHQIYSLGYLNPDSLSLLDDLANKGVLIVDIRLVACSRYRPHFSAKRLRARYGESYLRLRDLGNVNYKRPDAAIVLRDPAQGVPQLLALLEHHDVCLLCRCQKLTSCHTAVVLASIQQMCPAMCHQRVGERPMN